MIEPIVGWIIVLEVNNNPLYYIGTAIDNDAWLKTFLRFIYQLWEMEAVDDLMSHTGLSPQSGIEGKMGAGQLVTGSAAAYTKDWVMFRLKPNSAN